VGAENGACDRGMEPFRVEILVDGLVLYFLFLANFSGPRGFRVLRRCRPRVHRRCLAAGGCDVQRCSYPAPCPWSGAEVRLKSRYLEVWRAGISSACGLCYGRCHNSYSASQPESFASSGDRRCWPALAGPPGESRPRVHRLALLGPEPVVPKPVCITESRPLPC